MSKKTYKYNPETLNFEKVSKSCKSKILYCITTLIVVLILFVLFSFVYSSQFKTFKYKRLEARNEKIVGQYEELKKHIKEYEKKIASISKNDDYIYRTVLEKAPLSAELRNAGTGGAKKYEHLEKLDHGTLVIEVNNKLDNLLNQLKVQKNSYKEIGRLAEQKREFIDSKPGIQPISVKDFVRISSYFGTRIDPITGKFSVHKGLDLPARMNTSIYATGDGKVVCTVHSGRGYGNEIILEHEGGFTTRYAHLNKICVEDGDEVKRGQLIGLMGNSGKSTGPHLHYEVRLNGVPLNPRNFYFEDLSAEEYEQIINLSVKNNKDIG